MHFLRGWIIVTWTDTFQFYQNKMACDSYLVNFVEWENNEGTTTSWFNNYCAELWVDSTKSRVPWWLTNSYIIKALFSLQASAIYMTKLALSNQSEWHLKREERLTYLMIIRCSSVSFLNYLPRNFPTFLQNDKYSFTNIPTHPT